MICDAALIWKVFADVACERRRRRVSPPHTLRTSRVWKAERIIFHARVREAREERLRIQRELRPVLPEPKTQSEVKVHKHTADRTSDPPLPVF